MKSHDDDLVSNPVSTTSFGEIVDRRRRTLLTGAIAGVVLGAMPPGARLPHDLPGAEPAR